MHHIHRHFPVHTAAVAVLIRVQQIFAKSSAIAAITVGFYSNHSIPVPIALDNCF